MNFSVFVSTFPSEYNINSLTIQISPLVTLFFLNSLRLYPYKKLSSCSPVLLQLLGSLPHNNLASISPLSQRSSPRSVIAWFTAFIELFLHPFSCLPCELWHFPLPSFWKCSPLSPDLLSHFSFYFSDCLCPAPVSASSAQHFMGMQYLAGSSSPSLLAPSSVSGFHYDWQDGIYHL